MRSKNSSDNQCMLISLYPINRYIEDVEITTEAHHQIMREVNSLRLLAAGVEDTTNL